MLSSFTPLLTFLPWKHTMTPSEIMQKLIASQKCVSTKMGFEPTRAEPNGLAVHRLNHSATSSHSLAQIQ